MLQSRFFVPEKDGNKKSLHRLNRCRLLDFTGEGYTGKCKLREELCVCVVDTGVPAAVGMITAALKGGTRRASLRCPPEPDPPPVVFPAGSQAFAEGVCPLEETDAAKSMNLSSLIRRGRLRHGRRAEAFPLCFCEATSRVESLAEGRKSKYTVLEETTAPQRPEGRRQISGRTRRRAHPW